MTDATEVCGAQHGCERPENNPPHVCVRELFHCSAHGDFSGFEWWEPEQPHNWQVAP